MKKLITLTVTFEAADAIALMAAIRHFAAQETPLQPSQESHLSTAGWQYTVQTANNAANVAPI